jgi:hypothetical protein
MTLAIIALLIGPAVLGLAFGTRLVAIVPFVAWPLYYIGLHRRWWGCCGTGDGWQWVAALLTVVGVATTAAAAELGRRRRRAVG